MVSNNFVSMEKCIFVGMIYVIDKIRVFVGIMILYLFSNFILNYLNFYWFYKMIKVF